MARDLLGAVASSSLMSRVTILSSSLLTRRASNLSRIYFPKDQHHGADQKEQHHGAEEPSALSPGMAKALSVLAAVGAAGGPKDWSVDRWILRGASGAKAMVDGTGSLEHDQVTQRLTAARTSIFIGD